MLGFTLANRGGEEREGIISRGIIQPCTSGPVPAVFLLQEAGDDQVDNQVYGQGDQRVSTTLGRLQRRLWLSSGRQHEAKRTQGTSASGRFNKASQF